jgi:dienelactone hydrolase
VNHGRIGIVGIALLLLACRPAETEILDYRVFEPAGAGPHPAVLFVSGCAGFHPTFAPNAYLHRAERLRALGYIVVFVDYLGRRGLASCPDWIAGIDVAGEVIAAATWLRAQPQVDPARVFAMGWSHGGGAILDALAVSAPERIPFRRAVLFYPDCRLARPWRAPVPVLMHLAQADNVTPVWRCERVVQRASSALIKVLSYPDAHHGFDADELPARTAYGLGTVGYHPVAAAAAWEETQRFLAASP